MIQEAKVFNLFGQESPLGQGEVNLVSLQRLQDQIRTLICPKILPNAKSNTNFPHIEVVIKI